MITMGRPAFLLVLATCIAACVPPRSREDEDSAGMKMPTEAAPMPDGRQAFESRGFSQLPLELASWAGASLLGGGRALAGPLILSSAGGEILLAAFEHGPAAELLAIGADSSVLSSIELDARPFEAAAWNDTALLSFADGSLRAYALRVPPEGGMAEGGAAEDSTRSDPGALRLEMAWRRDGMYAARLLVLPLGRAAAQRADGGATCLEFASGEMVWSVGAGDRMMDCAYAAGLLVTCGPDGISARSDSNGGRVWSNAGIPGSVSVAAGGGRVASIDLLGRLAILDAADGRLVASATGRFDPAIRPAIDSGEVFAALHGGGFARVEAASGQTTRSWERPRPTSFLLLDENGIFGSSGPFLISCARYADEKADERRLPSDPLGALTCAADGSFMALSCARGILLAPAPPPVLDATFAPRSDAAEAIEGALAGFGGDWPGSRLLRYGDFTQGLPIHPAEAVVILIFDAGKGGRLKLEASPDPGDAILAVFDESGRLLASSVDELGARSTLALSFAQGREYWIVAGGRSAASETGYRLYLR